MKLRNLKILLLIFCIGFQCSNLFAQKFTTSIQNIVKGSKLQNHNILCVNQDSRGFIWIGTNLGLFKYDGYKFKEYLVTTNPSIINNNVKSILVVGTNLWVGTKGGISIIDLHKNTSHHLTDNVLNENYVTKLFLDADNNIWASHFSNKLSKHIGDYKFKHYSVPTKNEEDLLIIKDVVVNNELFFFKIISEIKSYSQIVKGVIKENSIESTTLLKDSLELSMFIFKTSKTVHSIVRNKLYKYNNQKDKFEFQKRLMKNDSIENSAIYLDSNKNILVGTKENTIFNLNNKSFEVENYTKLDDEKSWVNIIFIDKTGLIWIGTTSGLYKVKRNKILFETFLKDASIKNKMRSIVQDSKGDIYAVNQRSLFKYSKTKNDFINLNWRINNNISNPYAVIEKDENTFLIGTQNSGIQYYNKTVNSCFPFLESNHSFSNNHITKLMYDANGVLWIGTLEGLFYLNSKEKPPIKLTNNNSGQVLNIKETIFDIQPMSGNKFWVGTSTGLYLMSVNYGKEKFEISVEKDKTVTYPIRTLLLNANTLWIATQTEGVMKYNFSTKSIEKLNELKGLSNNTVYSLIPGNKNDLWFGTFKGLSRYDTVKKQFLNYYDFNGLADNEFNSSSQLVTKNGTIYFGGQNGISSIKSSENLRIKNELKLNISSIDWYDSKKNKIVKHYINNSKLEPLLIPNSVGFVHFEFMLSDFFHPQEPTFKYRAKGLQNDWVELKNSNNLSFSNFPSGDFILEVQASTNYGNWNNQKIELPISVKQVFYKTWWFYCIWGVLTLIIFYFIRNYELGHIRKIEQVRLQISRDLHDELGSSLAGIAIRAELLKEIKESEKKEEYLDEISSQSRSAVDSLSDIVWALDVKNNSIGDLYDRMESILFQLLTPLNIKYEFKPLTDKRYNRINQEYRQHIFLIFKEAITNIVKHANASLVTVSVTKDKNKLKLSIVDNGVGNCKERDTLNGHGIENMKLRVKKIKGTMKISNNKGFKLEIWFDYLRS